MVFFVLLALLSWTFGVVACFSNAIIGGIFILNGTVLLGIGAIYDQLRPTIKLLDAVHKLLKLHDTRESVRFERDGGTYEQADAKLQRQIDEVPMLVCDGCGYKGPKQAFMQFATDADPVCPKCKRK